MIDAIIQKLFEMADPDYKAFQSGLMPTVQPEKILGVRTPLLRKYAKDMPPDLAKQFMDGLPHQYYEENNLHSFLIEGIQDFDLCIKRMEAFLPYVDNWATCDGMKPRCFVQNKAKLISMIPHWLSSEHEYTVRFGIVMLMTHFLDSDFTEQCLAMAALERREYYIQMAVAWYFATALAKQWECAIIYLEEKRLDPWVHNKTIQKAVESYRISPNQKSYLRSLRV